MSSPQERYTKFVLLGHLLAIRRVFAEIAPGRPLPRELNLHLYLDRQLAVSRIDILTNFTDTQVGYKHIETLYKEYVNVYQIIKDDDTVSDQQKETVETIILAAMDVISGVQLGQRLASEEIPTIADEDTHRVESTIKNEFTELYELIESLEGQDSYTHNKLFQIRWYTRLAVNSLTTHENAPRAFKIVEFLHKKLLNILYIVPEPDMIKPVQACLAFTGHFLDGVLLGQRFFKQQENRISSESQFTNHRQAIYNIYKELGMEKYDFYDTITLANWDAKDAIELLLTHEAGERVLELIMGLYKEFIGIYKAIKHYQVHRNQSEEIKKILLILAKVEIIPIDEGLLSREKRKQIKKIFNKQIDIYDVIKADHEVLLDEKIEVKRVLTQRRITMDQIFPPQVGPTRSNS